MLDYPLRYHLALSKQSILKCQSHGAFNRGTAFLNSSSPTYLLPAWPQHNWRIKREGSSEVRLLWIKHAWIETHEVRCYDEWRHNNDPKPRANDYVFCTHLLAHATEELIQLEILPGVLQQQAELQFFNVVLGKDKKYIYIYTIWLFNSLPWKSPCY